MSDFPKFRNPLPRRIYDELLGTLGQCMSLNRLARHVEVSERVALRELRRLRQHGLVRQMPGANTVWEISA